MRLDAPKSKLLAEVVRPMFQSHHPSKNQEQRWVLQG
jgi:hypothetical protein